MRKITKSCIARVVIAVLFCLFVCPSLVVASGGSSDTEQHIAVSAADSPTAVEHSAAAGQEAAGEHHSDPLSKAKLRDLGWWIVNFIALMIILVKFGAKPLGSALSSRREAIITEISELEKRKSEAEREYQEFQGKLATIEADIDKIVERAVAQAEVEKKKILEKAEAAVDELQRSAQQAVQNEIAEAQMMLREEMADKAAVMAEKIIKKNLKASDQKAIIENYLARVEAVS